MRTEIGTLQEKRILRVCRRGRFYFQKTVISKPNLHQTGGGVSIAEVIGSSYPPRPEKCAPPTPLPLSNRETRVARYKETAERQGLHPVVPCESHSAPVFRVAGSKNPWLLLL